MDYHSIKPGSHNTAYQRDIYESTWNPLNGLPTAPSFDPRFSGLLLAGANMRQVNHQTVDYHALQATETEAVVRHMVAVEVERAIRPYVERQEQTHVTSKNDLRTLERRQYELEGFVSATRRLDYSPDTQMLEECSRGELRRVYIEAAEAREEVALRVEAVAQRLRAEAETLDEEEQIQLKSTQSQVASAQITGFACCGIDYECVDDLLEHVEKTHSTTPNSEGPLSDWIPVIVRQLPPITFDVPEHTETFTLDFLARNLGGDLWSPGFFFESGDDTILPSKSYWLLDSESEPFIPQSPGQHGAKLTAFFNDTAKNAPYPENYMNAPVFIIDKGSSEYRYYGNYSQSRCPDTVGYDTLHEHVPEHTLRRCADQLSDKGRPEWVTRALMNHFWPRPKYAGPIPPDSALNTPTGTGTSEESEQSVGRALDRYAERLRAWEKEARLRVNLLTSDILFESFKKPDQDTEPGLRLWWEYLECVNYDTGFYEMLVKFKHQPKLQKQSKKKKVVFQTPPTTPVPDVGGKTVTGDIETVQGDHFEKLTIPTPEEDESSHPPRRDPKKTQFEQWDALDVQQAEEQAKKPTTFVKPDFGERPKPKAKAQAAARSDKSHTQSVKPWETTKSTKDKNDDWGESSNSWQGVGDIEEAKNFRDEIPASRWQHDDKCEKRDEGAKRSGANTGARANANGKTTSISRGGSGRGGILPPHARGK